MGGIHQGGKVKIALSLQTLKYFLRAFTGIDHAKYLLIGHQFLGKIVPGQVSCLLECDPPKSVLLKKLRRTQLHYGALREKFMEERLQGRLGCRTQDGGNTIVLDQLGNGVDAGAQIGNGHHLGFIKDNDASGDVVEFAALRGTEGIEGFKKLHGGGHHNGNIPIFSGLCQRDIFRIRFLLHIIEHIGVVFQHQVLSQNGTEGLCGLFNDRGVGDHIDHAAQAVCFGVCQSKGEGGDGFTASGGDSQGEKPGKLPLSFLYAAFKNGTALLI